MFNLDVHYGLYQHSSLNLTGFGDEEQHEVRNLAAARLAGRPCTTITARHLSRADLIHGHALIMRPDNREEGIPRDHVGNLMEPSYDSFYRPELAPGGVLQVFDRNNQLLLCACSLDDTGAINTLSTSVAELRQTVHPRRHTVAGDRGNFQQLHFGVWVGQGSSMIQDTALTHHHPEAVARFLEANTPLFEWISGQLSVIAPHQCRRAKKLTTHLRRFYRSGPTTDGFRQLFGAWAAVALNLDQLKTRVHYDNGDHTGSFSFTLTFPSQPGGTWGGGDLVLWPLGLIVPTPPGTLVFFQSKLIAHSSTPIKVTDCSRNSIVGFTHGRVQQDVQGMIPKSKHERLSRRERFEKKVEKQDGDHGNVRTAMPPALQRTGAHD